MTPSLDRRACGFARILHELGCPPEARVAIDPAAGVEGLIALLGCGLTEAIAVILPRDLDAAGCAAWLQTTRCHTAVLDHQRAHATVAFPDQLRSMRSLLTVGGDPPEGTGWFRCFPLAMLMSYAPRRLPPALRAPHEDLLWQPCGRAPEAGLARHSRAGLDEAVAALAQVGRSARFSLDHPAAPGLALMLGEAAEAALDPGSSPHATLEDRPVEADPCAGLLRLGDAPFPGAERDGAWWSAPGRASGLIAPRAKLEARFRGRWRRSAGA